jgi:uncharacterized membrane protein YdjX (TVP38/TMEM64 family)
MVALVALSAAAIGWMVFLGGGQWVSESLTRAANLDITPASELFWLATFFTVAIVTQLLVIPSGSVLLVTAGFVFGAPLAAGSYALAQMITAWPVFTIARRAIRRRDRSLWVNHLEHSQVQPFLRSIDALRHDSFFTTIALRLTPVVPSAVACALAAVLDLTARGFLFGTLASCWIRPLFFASAGASLRSAGQLSAEGYEFSIVDTIPLLILFAAAVLILVSRLVLHRKTRNAQVQGTPGC